MYFLEKKLLLTVISDQRFKSVLFLHIIIKVLKLNKNEFKRGRSEEVKQKRKLASSELAKLYERRFLWQQLLFGFHLWRSLLQV